MEKIRVVPIIKKTLFLILLYFIPSLVSHAQTDNYTFTHLTMEDGLSQSTIFCILQDKTGFMWFGTTDGLNKYDGYNITQYYHNLSDSTSISGNSIRELYEDSSGHIWIGTIEGILNKFDKSTESFSYYDIGMDTIIYPTQSDKYYNYPLVFSRNINKTITSIIEADSSHLWIGTWGNGLILFDKNNLSAKIYLNDPADTLSLPSNRVTKLVKDNQGTLWIATFGGGLSRLMKHEKKDTLSRLEFCNYSSIEGNENSLSDNKIISLFIDKKNALWIATFYGGVNRLDSSQMSLNPHSAKFIHYQHEEYNNSSISGNSIMSFTEDHDGLIWVGTFGDGLNSYSYKDNSFTNYMNDPFNENSLADNDILSLLVDNSGVLWVGMHLGKGLSKLSKNSVKFGLIQSESGNSNSLNDDVVWAIYEDSNEVLWIGTYRGGLNKYDRKLNTFTYFMNDSSDINSISDNHVRVIKEDMTGNFWIGTYSGGLNRFDRSTNKFTRFIHNPNNSTSISSNQIQTIHIDSNNICWIGTFGGGLNMLDLNSYSAGTDAIFKKYILDDNNPESITDNRIYSLFEDHKGNLWVGTYGGGLNKFNKSTGKFISYRHNINDRNSISDDQILSILEDSDGYIWIGTNGGGLNKFNVNTQKFERYNKSRGVNSQVIYGILEDESKNLWLSSDIGLIKFNLPTDNVTYYDLKDGVQSMEFSGGAYFKNSNGKIFFGGINGVNYFFPDSIKSNTYVPPIVISEFKIFNEVLKGEHIEIELLHDQNFFTIEYAALDYTDPRNNQYAHYLEGLENDWQPTDAVIRRAYYTNLEPGSYIFRAKGSNNDGVWNQEGLALKLEILPPFWKTWWFIFLNVLLIGGIISFLISMKVRHLLAIEKLKVRLAADLHDNVGAGLTEISILSELASNEVMKYSQSSADKLQNISTTARHLVDSMSDIVWFVNPKRDSLHDLIIKLKDSYSDLLSEIGVSFRTNNLDRIIDFKIPMDVRQNLYLIFKEAIHNSIKHSKCNKISLETRLRGNVLEMTLRDDGIGLDQNNIKYGNGLRNMKDRASSLGGKLQIRSNDKKGTVIRFIGKLEKRSPLKFQ